MNLFKSVGVFTFVGFLNKGVSFLLLPFFTAYLSQADYGILNIFSNSIYFVLPLMNMGIDTIFLVNYSLMSKKELSEFISTSLVFPLGIFLLYFFIVSFTHPHILKFTGLSYSLVVLILIIALFNFLCDYFSSLMRAQNKSINLAIYTSCKVLIELILAVYFIKYLSKGFNGRVLSMLASSLLFGVIAVVFFIKNKYIAFKFSPHYFKQILFKGFPLVPAYFLFFFIGNTDNYLVNYYHGVKNAGIYGLACQFALIIAVLVNAFVTPYYTYMYDQFRKKNYKSVIKNSFIFLLFLLVAIVGLWLFSKVIFMYFIPQKFQMSAQFILPLAIGQFFWALFVLLLGYLYYKNENHKLFYISIAAILTTFAINFLIISNLQFKYAAYASAVSYFIAFLILFSIYAKRIYLRRQLIFSFHK